MQIYFIASLLFACLVAIFALQNSSTVAIRFLTWEVSNISQVLIIFGSAAVGALAVMFLGLGRHVKMLLQIRQLTNQKKQLESEVQDLRQQLDEFSSLEDMQEQSGSDVEELEPVPIETKPREPEPSEQTVQPKASQQ